MLYKTFGNFFAALAFIFAALAIHQSAAAYGAFASYLTSGYGFVVNNTVSQFAADEEARDLCENSGGVLASLRFCRGSNSGIQNITNKCVAIYQHNNPPQGGFGAWEGNTREAAAAGLASWCNAASDPCVGEPIDLSTVAVCDHTCQPGESPNDADTAGCHATTPADCDLNGGIEFDDDSQTFGCVCNEGYMGDGETCTPVDDSDISVTPEFTIGVGGETDLTTSADARHEVAFADVSAIQITVATTVDGFTYRKNGESSSELTVGLTDGVVGFNTTVSAGDYQIFVAAAQNNTVAATISLYLTVAEEIIVNPNPPPTTTNPPPTVTVTVTTSRCDGIVFVDDGNDGCELNSVFCPAPNIVEGPLCVADTEQMNVVTITATVTVTVMVAVLSEGENVINYAGELVTVTTQAGTTDAFGVLESGVHLQVAADVITPINTNVGGGGGGSSGGSAAGIIGGVVVVGLALWYFSSGGDDLSWTPSYAFQNNNGNISYSVGSRWTATANDWDLYWQNPAKRRQIRLWFWNAL